MADDKTSQEAMPPTTYGQVDDQTTRDCGEALLGDFPFCSRQESPPPTWASGRPGRRINLESPGSTNRKTQGRSNRESPGRARAASTGNPLGGHHRLHRKSTRIPLTPRIDPGVGTGDRPRSLTGNDPGV
ncbi:hypothetical protein L6452_28045 [Arctium lappa]|uniref:Uncharacterized protein n=1 Tax=Arctium lappa TaxID=4217 RepID=A0ACB8ZYD2_ARCLA|nr:hypothetical protein L6452_28045 [Arctium lappa]